MMFPTGLRFEMDKFWNILSLNADEDGLEFISSFEAKDFPIFGTQFHPEKNAYEWAPSRPGIPHSKCGNVLKKTIGSV